MDDDRSIIVLVRRTGPTMYDAEIEIDGGPLDIWACRAYLQAAADILTAHLEDDDTP